jgi:nitrogen fixation protein FixH
MPPAGIELTARLAHPADARRDRPIPVREFAPGVFTGTIEADPGQWDLLIDIARNGERLFRSKSRITLR